MATVSLYYTDFYKWSQEQTQLLRLGWFNEIDSINIIEEIEDMGKRQKQYLRNRLLILLMNNDFCPETGEKNQAKNS